MADGRVPDVELLGGLQRHGVGRRAAAGREPGAGDGLARPVNSRPPLGRDPPPHYPVQAGQGPIRGVGWRRVNRLAWAD